MKNKKAVPTSALLTVRLYHFPVARLTVGLTRHYYNNIFFIISQKKSLIFRFFSKENFLKD